MSRRRRSSEEEKRVRDRAISSDASHRAKLDQRNVPADEGWGTSPSSMGEVKMQSEEARLVKCPECGASGGRHLSVCSRK